MYLKSTTVLAHAGLNATLHPDPLRLSVDKKGATLSPGIFPSRCSPILGFTPHPFYAFL